jgi:hypothetical protein
MGDASDEAQTEADGNRKDKVSGSADPRVLVRPTLVVAARYRSFALLRLLVLGLLAAAVGTIVR